MQSPTIEQSDLNMSLTAEILAFQVTRKTLQLATMNKNGLPNVSYAPFVHLQDGYYILISELAAHTQNILNNPNVSLMMIEDEVETQNIYARKRLTFTAKAVVVSCETGRWKEVITSMVEKLGETAQMLSQLSDFHLIRLETEGGLYVKGFGKAYQISANSLIDFVHLNKGHQRRVKAT